MRTITRRLTVKNDGFCRSNKPANERINDVAMRYVNKMYKNGWIPTFVSAGNAFFYYEMIIAMNMPKNEDERTCLIEKAADCNWTFNEGVITRD